METYIIILFVIFTIICLYYGMVLPPVIVLFVLYLVDKGYLGEAKRGESKGGLHVRGVDPVPVLRR